MHNNILVIKVDMLIVRFYNNAFRKKYGSDLVK